MHVDTQVNRPQQAAQRRTARSDGAASSSTHNARDSRQEARTGGAAPRSTTNEQVFLSGDSREKSRAVILTARDGQRESLRVLNRHHGSLPCRAVAASPRAGASVSALAPED